MKLKRALRAANHLKKYKYKKKNMYSNNKNKNRTDSDKIKRVKRSIESYGNHTSCQKPLQQ